MGWTRKIRNALAKIDVPKRSVSENRLPRGVVGNDIQ
jgi:hypothetical protein